MKAKPRILVVEDEKPIRDLLELRLNKPYEVSCASCQDEAYEQLKQPDFDLVLLDLKLPRRKRDMESSTDVGVGILRHIRDQKLRRRRSDVQLPVVVMTAFGTEKLFSAEFLGGRGACDYMPKPFGEDDALEKKIERALCGEGAFTPASTNTSKAIQLCFSPADDVVFVESLQYSGAARELLAALRDVFLPDHHALTPPANFRAQRSLELAERWQISDEAVRKRVADFRAHVAREFQVKLGRVLGDNDIVENERKWQGYRLNPVVVKLVAWEQTKGPSRS